MNGDSHRGIRELLGSYALGHLDGDERLSVQAHLDACAACRAELAELAPLAVRLDPVDANRVEGAGGPPADLEERVLQRIRAERPQPRTARRVAPVLAAAAVTLIVGAGAFWAGAASGAGPDLPLEPVTVQALDPAVDASANLVPHTWGMEIKLDASGFDTGEAYRVTVGTETGQQVSAGEFLGTGAAPMSCNLNSSVRRADATSFAVLDEAGAVVLTAELA